MLVPDKRLQAGLTAALAMEGYVVQPVSEDPSRAEDPDGDGPDLLVIDLRAARAELELVRHLRSPRPRPRVSAAQLELGDLVLDPETHLATRRGRHLNLTATEFGILALLARQPGAVIAKSALLRELRGNAEQSVNLVEVHVSSLRRKLEAFGPRIVHTVRGVGYTLRPLLQVG
jgi:DNA-binding response OmpR family regulator